MKQRVLAAFLFIAILWAVPLQADTINFTVNSSDIGRRTGQGFIDFHSSSLNGTMISGQTLSIDALLSDDLIARAWLFYPGSFSVLLIVETAAPGFPGFPGTDSTGYLIAPDSDPAFSTLTAQRTMNSEGDFGLGIVESQYPQLTGAQSVDFRGVHFDMITPTVGAVVTDTRLRISYGKGGLSLGTVAQLPEVPSLALLPLGLIAIAVVRKRASISR